MSIDSSLEPSPAELFQKLKDLDPEVQQQQYKTGSGTWDTDALRDDLATTKGYTADSLDEALAPLNEELRQYSTQSIKDVVVEIIPNLLYLGSRSSALDVHALRRRGIRSVINCAPQSVTPGKNHYGDLLAQYIELWQDDHSDYCVVQDVDAVWDIIQKPANQPALLHCDMNGNRSTALAVAVHMRHMNKITCDPVEALRYSTAFVADHKGSILSNPGFQRQLLLFAKLGMRWFSTCKSVWRTALERRVARVRLLAEKTIRGMVVELRHDIRWRELVRIRDSWIRAEAKLEKPFCMDSVEEYTMLKRRLEGFIRRKLAGLKREHPRATPEPKSGSIKQEEQPKQHAAASLESKPHRRASTEAHGAAQAIPAAPAADLRDDESWGTWAPSAAQPDAKRQRVGAAAAGSTNLKQEQDFEAILDDEECWGNWAPSGCSEAQQAATRFMAHAAVSRRRPPIKIGSAAAKGQAKQGGPRPSTAKVGLRVPGLQNSAPPPAKPKLNKYAVIALSSWSPANSGLSEPEYMPLTKGDRLMMRDGLEEGWAFGEDSRGKSGYFPPSYVERLELHAADPSLKNKAKDKKIIPWLGNLRSLLHRMQSGTQPLSAQEKSNVESLEAHLHQANVLPQHMSTKGTNLKELIKWAHGELGRRRGSIPVPKVVHKLMKAAKANKRVREQAESKNRKKSLPTSGETSKKKKKEKKKKKSKER